MPRAFTVKVPPSFPAVSSDQVRRWLTEHFMHGAVGGIAPDPGAGERVVRLSLPEVLVAKLAAGLSESPAVALRRLIATRGRALPGVQGKAARPAPPLGSEHPAVTRTSHPQGPHGGLLQPKPPSLLERLIEASPNRFQGSLPQPNPARAAARASDGSGAVLFLTLLVLALFFLLLFWLWWRGRKAAAAALLAAPAPTRPFLPWRPLP